MRVWVDLTNCPHVLVMRPIIEVMREDGHEVEVTARDFAQTLELCDRLGARTPAVGRHRGGRLAARGRPGHRAACALARWARSRAASTWRWARLERRHGRGGLLRVPSATAFDYEWAAVQHT